MLTPSTIQSHLAYFVEEKQLDIRLLISDEKREDILSFYSANPKANLSEAKAHFGSKYDMESFVWS